MRGTHSIVQVGGRALPPAANHSVCVSVCASYHAVHSEVVVLGLQLYGVGVVVANLCVACQEQTLVVHDPVKHLRHRGMTEQTHRKGKKKKLASRMKTYTHKKGKRLIINFHRSLQVQVKTNSWHLAVMCLCSAAACA